MVFMTVINKILLIHIILPVLSISYATVWVNNQPDAFVKRIEIFPGHNTPLQADYLVNITFQNDVTYLNLELKSTTGSLTPSFLLTDYTHYVEYYCESDLVLTFCDGIAMKIAGGQLCAGYFRYNMNTPIVITITDIGCFEIERSIIPSRLDIDKILSKLNKEKLIDIIIGRRPISPIGPICLTCPPWETYEKDLTIKLKGLKVRKFKVDVREIR